jgi:glutamate--cysteine ligase catalytic subunit
VIETTPLEPYTGSVQSLREVEANLGERRQTITEHLAENESLLTLPVFPMLGTEPLVDLDNPEQPNINIDDVISDGPYSVAKYNIEARSGHQADIRVPVYRDHKTTLPHELRLNHMIFGPGGCGLQATFQCRDLHEARVLHDQLVVLGPIFLALTAATPVYQSVLVDTDVRWNQTAAAIDDRTADEFSQVAERWSAAPMYLREDIGNLDEKLDPTLQSRVNDYSELLKSTGMDPVMATYFAHLHLRDPLYLSTKTGKYEEVTPEEVHQSICKSVWSHVRLKIPEPEASGMGWRVEFRPMEVQLTDFENAAVLVFLDLVRQVLAHNPSQLQPFMPLSLVKENMDRAHARNAVVDQKFWFPQNGEPVEMNMDQIINGDRSGKRSFPGLLSLIEELLANSESHLEQQLRTELEPYLDFISKRACGEEPTPAQWMRQFIRRHGDYRHDSVLTDIICYDMLLHIADMGNL